MFSWIIARRKIKYAYTAYGNPLAHAQWNIPSQLGQHGLLSQINTFNLSMLVHTVLMKAKNPSHWMIKIEKNLKGNHVESWVLMSRLLIRGKSEILMLQHFFHTFYKFHYFFSLSFDLLTIHWSQCSPVYCLSYTACLYTEVWTLKSY